jgi:hypothetical protein
MDDESPVDIISSWNIAEYLPKKIQVSYLLCFNSNKELNAMGRSTQWISKVIHLKQALFCMLHV